MTAVTNLIDIPLSKLVLWTGNVRKTNVETGLDELAASIAAHGLLNPLLVRKAAKGRYAVVAGQRRYLALRRLAKAGTMDKAALVSCHLRDDAQDDAELSLAENEVRVAMHPADQFEAWRGLIDKGATVSEIAVRFGVTESTVKKRLALARVSPAIFALYREGAIALDALQAFTVTDDHAAQESVWQSLGAWQRNDARAIREALTETDVPSRDRRVRFVGLDMYEAAGGIVRRDLFDPENGGYAQDAALLDRLTMQKLDAVADAVKAEGWCWAETRLTFGWDDRRSFQQAEAVETPLPEAEQAEADRLHDELEALCEADYEDEPDAEAKIQAIEARLEAIEAMASMWPDDIKARAGAIVYLAHDGTAEIVRGLVREEDAPASPSGGRQIAESGSATGGPGLPASLVEELTAQKTAALRIELARSPDIALALVVHAMATSAFYFTGDKVLKLSLTSRSLRPSIKEHDTCRAVLALDEEPQRIRQILPDEQADLWDWCLNVGRDQLLDVLAVAAAHGIDAVETKADPNRGGTAHGQALASALQLDMANWYRPTAAGYFGRISKAAILADLEAARQAPCAPAWLKMKKGELAVLAEREIPQGGWLPGPLC